MVTVSRSARKDWRSVVCDSEARQVFEALDDPEWDFRTIDGLTRATGLSQDRIEQILREYRPLVRQAAVLNRGRELYTLASRRPKFRELLSTARAFIAKTPSTE